MYGITDEYGLTLPNQYINLFVPATQRNIPLYVKFRKNSTWTLLNYGPLPTTTSTGFSTYASGVAGSSGAGAATASAAGQIPASAWVKGLQFNVPTTFFVTGTFPFGNNDIWYTQTPSKLFEVSQSLWPGWLRAGIDIPVNQVGESLQEQVSGGVDQDFGWSRGKTFTAHIPWVHYGYNYGNDTNFQVNTRAIFRYAEQEVSLVRDPMLVFQIINNIVPNHLITLPVNQQQSVFDAALLAAYGFPGFPTFPRALQGTAISQYSTILEGLRGKGPA